MARQFTLATLGYLLPTFAWGVTWYLVLFPKLYHGLGIYNRADPIIPLGFFSMFIQALLLAYLYPFFYRGGSPAWRGVQFGWVMGGFLYSVATLADAAKINVNGMGTWLGMQAVFTFVQFTVTGALIGLAYRTAPLKAGRATA